MVPLNGAFCEMCHCVLPQALCFCFSDLPPVPQSPSCPTPARLPLPPSLFCTWSSSVAQSSCLSYLHCLTLSQVPATGFPHQESCSAPTSPHFYCPLDVLFSPALGFFTSVALHHSFPCPSHSAALSIGLDKEAVSFYLLPR